jgi:hypothetical protein
MDRAVAVSGGETYFARAIEQRLWAGLRTFPGRPLYACYPPFCDDRHSFGD